MKPNTCTSFRSILVAILTSHNNLHISYMMTKTAVATNYVINIKTCLFIESSQRKCEVDSLCHGVWTTFNDNGFSNAVVLLVSTHRHCVFARYQ